MRILIAAILLCAACGGGTTFPGDNVIADLRGGQPYCGQGRTGPALLPSVATVRDRLGNPLYDSQILECDWTCGNTGPLHGAFVYALFFTDQQGAWKMDDLHADPSRGTCPTD